MARDAAIIRGYKMDYDTEEVDEYTLALLYLVTH